VNPVIWWALGAFALIVLVGWRAKIRYNRIVTANNARHAKLTQLRRLIGSVTEGDPEATKKLQREEGDWRKFLQTVNQGSPVRDEFQKALDLIAQRRDEDSFELALCDSLIALKNGLDPEQELNLLAAALRNCENNGYYQFSDQRRLQIIQEAGFDLEQARCRLAEPVWSEHYRLLMVASDSVEAFEGLKHLIMRTQNTYSGGDLWRVGVAPLDYPDDWNDLVNYYYQSPGLGDYVGLPKVTPGMIVQQVGLALASEHKQNHRALFFDTKILHARAIAGCESLPLHGVLFADLVKLIGRLERELSSHGTLGYSLAPTA
jgi:hypothetical protein